MSQRKVKREREEPSVTLLRKLAAELKVELESLLGTDDVAD